MEPELVERFTLADLATLARFYGTPEGRVLGRKGIAYTAAIRPKLAAELAAWAQSLRPDPPADQAIGTP